MDLATAARITGLDEEEIRAYLRDCGLPLKSIERGEDWMPAICMADLWVLQRGRGRGISASPALVRADEERDPTYAEENGAPRAAYERLIVVERGLALTQRSVAEIREQVRAELADERGVAERALEAAGAASALELRQAREELAVVGAERDLLEVTAEARKREIQALEARLSELGSEHTDRGRELETVRADARGFVARIAGLITDLDAAKDALGAGRAALVQLRQERAEADERHAAHEAELLAERTKLCARLASAESALAHERDRAAHVAKELDVARQVERSVQRWADRQEAELASLRAKYADLESRAAAQPELGPPAAE